MKQREDIASLEMKPPAHPQKREYAGTTRFFCSEEDHLHIRRAARFDQAVFVELILSSSPAKETCIIDIIEIWLWVKTQIPKPG